jgi:hypothetical protein
MNKPNSLKDWRPPLYGEGESPPAAQTPLDRYSITFKTEELAQLAQSPEPLLGPVCLANQTTVFYAKPNTGKTLLLMKFLIDAVKQGRIEGGSCYYINADDNPAGILEKAGLLQPYGINMIAPGLEGFDISLFWPILEKMRSDGTARRRVVVLDTAKKVTDLMDKRESSRFGSLSRSFIMAGGTLVATAHTNKRPDADGSAIFAGTSDIIDDIDCAYMVEAVPSGKDEAERLIKLRKLKKRGNNPEEVAYSYSTAVDLSYAGILGSLRERSEADLECARVSAQRDQDAEVIETVEDCLREASLSKTDLLATAMRRLKYVGRNKIDEIIDRYTGDNAELHHWSYDKSDRGKRRYWLLSEGGPKVDPDEVF